MKRPLVLATLLLLLAACGGGGNGDAAKDDEPASAAATTTTTGDVSDLPPEEQFSYQEGLEQCSFYSLKDLAGTLGVAENAEAVAKAMARDEPDPKLREAIRRGCLDSLKQTKGKGPAP